MIKEQLKNRSQNISDDNDYDIDAQLIHDSILSQKRMKSKNSTELIHKSGTSIESKSRRKRSSFLDEIEEVLGSSEISPIPVRRSKIKSPGSSLRFQKLDSSSTLSPSGMSTNIYLSRLNPATSKTVSASTISSLLVNRVKQLSNNQYKSENSDTRKSSTIQNVITSKAQIIPGLFLEFIKKLQNVSNMIDSSENIRNSISRCVSSLIPYLFDVSFCMNRIIIGRLLDMKLLDMLATILSFHQSGNEESKLLDTVSVLFILRTIDCLDVPIKYVVNNSTYKLIQESQCKKRKLTGNSTTGDNNQVNVVRSDIVLELDTSIPIVKVMKAYESWSQENSEFGSRDNLKVVKLATKIIQKWTKLLTY